MFVGVRLDLETRSRVMPFVPVVERFSHPDALQGDPRPMFAQLLRRGLREQNGVTVVVFLEDATTKLHHVGLVLAFLHGSALGQLHPRRPENHHVFGHPRRNRFRWLGADRCDGEDDGEDQKNDACVGAIRGRHLV